MNAPPLALRTHCHLGAARSAPPAPLLAPVALAPAVLALAVLVLALLSPAPAVAQQQRLAGDCAPSAVEEKPADAPLSRRLSARTMARAGLTRVEDLFWLLDEWEATSFDGYTVRPSAVGMPGAPLVVAGGMPLTDGPFGQPPLVALPVHLQQVRTAEASTAPQLAAGRLAADGTVRLGLCAPAPGLAAQAAFSAGNAVGDPGPFRGTERSVVNVDRIGPQYLLEASVRTPAASAQLSLRTVRHYTTDRLIRARAENVQDTLDGPPLQYLTAPRLSVTLRDAVPGTHRLTAQYVNLRALPLFPTLGYEVPARRRHAEAGLQGHFDVRRTRGAPPVSNGPRLRYRLGLRRATLETVPERTREADPALFDWTEDRLDARLELTRLPRGAHLGLSADYARADAGTATLDDDALLTTRAYAAADGPRLARARPRLTLVLAQTDGQIGGGALLSSRFALGAAGRDAAGRDAPLDSLAVHLGYVRRPYAEDGSFWYWLKEGLDAPRAEAARPSLPSGTLPASTRLTADLRFSHAFPAGGHFALEASARHFRRLTLLEADYGFARTVLPSYVPPGGVLVPDLLRLRPEAGGQTFRLAAEAARTFPEALRHRLRYDVFAHRAAGGSGARAFEQRFRRTPRHRLGYTARLSVGRRFAVQGRFDFRSAERWPAYRRAAVADGSPYRHRLPARLRVDLAATKRFWGDHLRARLALRNLLDAPLRTHPAGPERRLALFVSIEGRL